MHLLLLCAVIRWGAAPADYAVDNDDWNGLSRFWQLAGSTRILIRLEENLDWSRLHPRRDALFFLSSERVIPPAKLWMFLHQGGRAAVVEDFRGGSSVFLDAGLLLEEERDPFPVAVPMVENHSLTRGMQRLICNHPASFVPVATPLWAFPDSGRALVLETGVGAGKLLLVSDPSLLINDMLGQGDNRLFARHLLEWLSESGRQVHLLVRYDERNWPAGERSPLSGMTLRRQLVLWWENARDILSQDKVGARLLGILLLAPFLYALLTLALQPVRRRERPPRHLARAELSPLWLRLLALSELVTRKLQLETLWYAAPRAQLRERADAHFGGNSARTESFLQLAKKLSHAFDPQGVRSVDPAHLSLWVEELENFLDDFQGAQPLHAPEDGKSISR